jgi:hypothetical protein
MVRAEKLVVIQITGFAKVIVFGEMKREKIGEVKKTLKSKGKWLFKSGGR